MSTTYRQVGLIWIGVAATSACDAGTSDPSGRDGSQATQPPAAEDAAAELPSSSDAAVPGSDEAGATDEAGADGGQPEGSDGGALPITLARSCGDSVDAVYEDPGALPAYDASRRGDVLRCAFDRALSVSELTATLRAGAFQDVDVKSALRVYRIAYRTDRLLGHEGISTALLFLPDQPLAQAPPLLVGAHGFSANGLLDQCRFSRLFELGDGRSTEMSLWLALASYGYPVLAPDYSGWTEGASSTFLASEDEAHALLDGTRAARNLLTPGMTSDQVVMVGHSQGGHAVLSAQALAASYGLAGELVAVVPFAPPWVVGRTWAAALSPLVGFNTADNPGAIGLALSYFYSHAELYDGAGSGLALYRPEKRAIVRQAAGGECTFDAVRTALAALGPTPADFLEPDFLDSVSLCGVLGGAACATGPAATWLPRFRADRPALDAQGAEIVWWQGREDTLATPELARCGIDKIRADLAGAGSPLGFTVCADRGADHESVLSRHATWTARWIAARTLGAPAPDACPGIEALAPEDGGVLTCPALPGNVD